MSGRRGYRKSDILIFGISYKNGSAKIAIFAEPFRIILVRHKPRVSVVSDVYVELIERDFYSVFVEGFFDVFGHVEINRPIVCVFAPEFRGRSSASGYKTV